MVKVPSTDEELPRGFTAKRTQFLHDYGALLSLWSHFELSIEVKIARLANLAPKDATIILGGLNFGSKPDILYSLLDQRDQNDVAGKVRAVINHVRRNALVHGVAGADDKPFRFAFFKREVGSRYEVKHLIYTPKQFNAHFEQFRELMFVAQDAMGVHLDDLEEYGREAGLFEATPPRRQGRPQRAATSKKSSNSRLRRLR